MKNKMADACGVVVQEMNNEYKVTFIEFVGRKELLTPDQAITFARKEAAFIEYNGLPDDDLAWIDGATKDDLINYFGSLLERNLSIRDEEYGNEENIAFLCDVLNELIGSHLWAYHYIEKTDMFATTAITSEQLAHMFDAITNDKSINSSVCNIRQYSRERFERLSSLQDEEASGGGCPAP